uniref:Uncharacterized protein n=1 Tax=Pavo cristatus TaxID=9049 RepID=A0A8C9FU16_PAVCR
MLLWLTWVPTSPSPIYIQLLHEDFTEIEPKDPRLQNAKVILLIPQCSGLGFSNPIDFILTEHGGNF